MKSKADKASPQDAPAHPPPLSAEAFQNDFVWPESGQHVFVNDYVQEIKQAEQDVEGAQSSEHLQQAEDALRALKAKVYLVGPGDFVELCVDDPSKRPLGKVVRVSPEDGTVLLQNFYRCSDVADQVKSTMQQGEVLKTNQARHYPVQQLERKVTIAPEMPLGDTPLADGVYHCSRGVHATSKNIIEVPGDMTEPVPMGLAFQVGALPNTEKMYLYPSEGDKKKQEDTAAETKAWSSGSSPSDQELAEYLLEATNLVPAVTGTIVHVRPQDPAEGRADEGTAYPDRVDPSRPFRWGLVSGGGPQDVAFVGGAVVSGDGSQDVVVVEGEELDRERVLVAGAHQFAMDMLFAAGGNPQKAVEMMRNKDAFIAEHVPAGILWSEQQLQELCDVSSQLSEQQRAIPLGDLDVDEANFSVTGKSFIAMMDAWRRFKPALRFPGAEDKGKGKKRGAPAPVDPSSKRGGGATEPSGTPPGSGGASSSQGAAPGCSSKE